MQRVVFNINICTIHYSVCVYNTKMKDHSQEIVFGKSISTTNENGAVRVILNVP